MSRYGYRKYVPVAERRAKAVKKASQRKSSGQEVQPIHIEGRKIAKSFWGEAWCRHVESFGDYSNRLPRGRTYVRNGSVWHLEIKQGKVLAEVFGSSSYKVEVSIQTLPTKKWEALKQKCAGQIGSLLELMSGRMSDSVMKEMTDPTHGLLPSTSEIRYGCSCPDWASMCKHIAAVIYGIGARLDERPELLFLLRGVDHEELVSETSVDAVIDGQPSKSTRRRRVAEVQDVFGFQLEDEAPKPKTKSKPKKKTVAKTKKQTDTQARRATTPKAAPKKAATVPVKTTSAKSKKAEPTKPFKATGRNVQGLRKAMGLTQKSFAETLGVSAISVSNWENTQGALSMRDKNVKGLEKLWKEHG